MWKVALLLMLTLVALPLAAYHFDAPPTDAQWAILRVLVAMALAGAAACFVAALATGNYSQVDKLWSVAPVVYAWTTVALADADPRLVLMAVLVTVWGTRLTLNFARRGGYAWPPWRGEEDYRWEVLRQRPEFRSPWARGLFVFFFVSVYQMLLILAFTIPIVKCVGGARPLGWTDAGLALLFLACVFVETVADQQQWTFQRRKRLALASGSYAGPGFAHEGLWALSRHPNYAAEQATWIVFYLFSVAATGVWVNWSIVGCILLLLLFKGSVDFSEGITGGKYPAYEDYRQRVPRFVPRLRPREAEREGALTD